MRTEVYWIPGPAKGRLAIAARPRGGDWLEDEVQDWRTLGVDTVLSLLTPEEVEELDVAHEAQLARGKGIQFLQLPIPDRGLPSSSSEVARLVAELAEVLDSGGTLLLRCRQGIGRSSLVAAAVLVHLGESPEAALATIEQARGRPVPDTEEQRRWVEEFAAIAGSRGAHRRREHG